MKKIYSIIFFLLPFLALAQPTITQSDFATPGHAWVDGTDTTYSNAITAGGANQTWDYTSLLNQRQDTNAFATVASTPYAALFSSSNLAAYASGSTDWGYYTTNSSGWYLDGAYSGGTIVHFNPSEL